MDEACVHKALRTLLYYEIIALVDIFQFHNTYTTTHNYTGTHRTHTNHTREQFTSQIGRVDMT
jgi:hypothetical protein